MDWEEVKVQAAISALQGVMESGTIGEILEIAPGIIAKQSVRIANYLVAELQRNADNKTLDEEIKEGCHGLFHHKKS